MTEPQALAGGRYLLVKRLGEGGMATVYRAFDQRLQVWRAIKVLLPDYARRKKIMARFEAEAQTMALLEHPNIVRVYDVDRDGDFPYIVMEIIEGGSLVDLLEKYGPMPPRMAVDVIVESCQALQFAHDKGVIHRDIKPHNIMVDRDGVCRLTDFGIARAGDSDVNLTKTGAVMGTWGYMAPEQRSDAKHVDERADVYAIAATLYSLLTDKTPMDLFAAEHDASMLEGVPEPLVPVLIKATEYRKENRYESAASFSTALLAVRDELADMPADAFSLKPVVEPMEPPPPTLADTTGNFRTPVDAGPAPMPAAQPAEGAGGQTLAPGTMAEQSGSFTMADFTEAEVSQPHGAYTPSPADLAGTRADEGSNRGIVGLVVAAVVLLAAGGGLAAYVVTSAGVPTEAPTPDLSEVAAAAPTPDVAPADDGAADAGAETPSEGPVAKAAPPKTTPKATSGGSAPKTTPKATTPTKATTSGGSADDGASTEATPPAETTSSGGSSEAATTPAPAADDPGGTTEAAPETPPPPPEPKVASQCFKKVTAPSAVSMGDSFTVRATTCKQGKVTLHYRPKGGTWYTKNMGFILGGYSAVVPIGDTFTDGVEWYLSSDGATEGSAGSPRFAKLQ